MKKKNLFLNYLKAKKKFFTSFVKICNKDKDKDWDFLRRKMQIKQLSWILIRINNCDSVFYVDTIIDKILHELIIELLNYN